MTHGLFPFFQQTLGFGFGVVVVVVVVADADASSDQHEIRHSSAPGRSEGAEVFDQALELNLDDGVEDLAAAEIPMHRKPDDG